MNLETKITIYKFTPQLFTLTRESHGGFHKMYVVEIVNVLSR